VARAVDAEGDLAPVGDQDFLEQKGLGISG